MQLNTKLYCQYSGLEIGFTQLEVTAGALPYLSHWDKMIARHPVFSLSEFKLFQFAKIEWNRLNKRMADEELSGKEERILQVTWLAVLHSFGSIKQDQPALPELHIVQTTLSRMLALSYWKYYLESNRFRFPTYHICKINENLDFAGISDYLDLCFQVKNDYETKLNDIQEKDKAEAADRALKALADSWITPVSRKILWAWTKSQLPAIYDADKVGWMNTLFLGGGNAIIEFAEEDIELLEEIITSHCPPGTGIMGAVRDRIAAIWKIWKDHHQTFDIDLADYAKNQGVLVNGLQVEMPDPGCAPQQKDYESKVKYAIAIAKWTIAKRAFDAQSAKSDDPIINKLLGEL